MLPRYRLLVEKLAQQGLLPVICGTDTLGVGINVPIHTVLLTALTKFDGYRMRRLRAREFHQIAGRAGRSGFDEGMVLEQNRARYRECKSWCKRPEATQKSFVRSKKQPPEGFVTWNKQTLERLIDATPETLKPRMKITHSMVLSEVVQGGDAARTRTQGSLTILRSPTRRRRRSRCARMRYSIRSSTPGGGAPRYKMAVWNTSRLMPEDFALDQPLSPFLLAALELLDPESDTYAYDVISMAEATLEESRVRCCVLRSARREAVLWRI